MHKITFSMVSPICYYSVPILDSIVAYARYCTTRKSTDYHSPTGREVSHIDIPIKKHDLGFYMASYMFSDTTAEGQDAWRKRWETKHDDLAHFGRGRRRVDISSGKYKSYDIPIVTQSVKKVWFYFDGDPAEVRRLIIDNLPGFGKKVSIGFGWFSDVMVETEADDDLVYFRPLPLAFAGELARIGQRYLMRVHKAFGAYKMPYWLPEHQTDIFIPEKINV